jgi:hypothetical protein
MERNYPPYLTNRLESLRLVAKIANYWVQTGRTDVNVWLEYEKDGDGQTLYYIRSNLKFRSKP